MDKQADPVADLAGDTASAAPEADAADRQPSLTKVKKDAGPQAESAEAESRPQPAPAPAPEPSVFTPRPKPTNGASSATVSVKRPSFLKGGRKRADVTVPMDLARQAGVQKATGGLTAAGDDEPDVTDVSADRGATASTGSGTEETTSTLAAAALARELTGAGFATPGFARPAAGGGAGSGAAAEAAAPGATAEDATVVKESPSPSPSGTVPPSGQPASTSSVTNPAWTPPAGSPSDRPASSNWSSSASGPAAPLGSGYSPSSGSSDDENAVGAAAGFAAGATLGAAAADKTVAAQRAEPVSAPTAGPGYPPPVPSENQKSKVGRPFARPGKKKLRPNAGAKPGGAIGNGKVPMSVKSKPGTASRPAAQMAPKNRTEPTEVRDAQLVLSRVEPWSVMKFSFMISLVGFVILFVVVAVLYFAFSALGVFHAIEQTVGLVTSSKGSAGTNASSWFSAGTVLSYTLIAGTIDVILITALSTVGAVIYNAITHLTGGIEITLAEAD